MVIPQLSSRGSPRASMPLLRSSAIVAPMSSHMSVSWWRTPLSNVGPSARLDAELCWWQGKDEPSLPSIDMLEAEVVPEDIAQRSGCEV